MLFDVNAWLGTWPFRSLRSNTAELLVERLDRSGIRWAAVSSLEAIFHRNAMPANLRLLEEIERRRDRLIPIATINPTYVKWEDDLARCAQLGMRGVRLFPAYHGYEADGPEAVRAATACAGLGLPVLIPQRMEDERQRHRLDPGKTVDLGRIANLIAAVPHGVYVIQNARGIPRSPLWQRGDLRRLSWYVDLSLSEVDYLLHRDVRSMRDLAELVEQGGAGRLLFGTHLPFSYAAPALVKLAVLDVDPKTREEIAYRKALAIFGLFP